MPIRSAFRFARRLRASLRRRHHHHGRRERRRQIHFAGGDCGAGLLCEAGRGKGYRPVDHSNALEVMGGKLSWALRAAWLPKVTEGWFFRAETFFSVARFLDATSQAPPDFLSYSHGEGFLRFFDERCQRHGIYIFDEPESALSPARQMKFLKLMRRTDEAGYCQVIMAAHSPMLMDYPNATLLRLSKYGLEPVSLRDTDHFRTLREFCEDPKGFVKAARAE